MTADDKGAGDPPPASGLSAEATGPHSADNDFEPLAAALGPWLGKPFSELRAELRQRMAAQIDCSRDPANEYEQNFWLTLFSHRCKSELEKTHVLKATNGSREYWDKKEKRAERKLAALTKIEDYVTSIACNEQRAAAMKRVLDHWKERGKITDGLKALICQPVDASGISAPGLGKVDLADGLEVATTPPTVSPPAEQVAAEGAAPADPRPRPTNPAVRKWMRERVAEWPGDKPAPNEAEDFAAETAHFAPGLSRDQFRIVRESETPPEWRKQGPRGHWSNTSPPKD